MMSSVIPARLQFQCGHAALVTLPRVKGESSVQRNERIAREKSAALTRQCDFCGPTVQVVVSASDEANRSHMLAAELTAPEVEMVVAEPVAVIEEQIQLVEEEPVLVVEEPVILVEVEEEPILVIEEPILVIEEPFIVVEEEPVVIIAEVLPEPVEPQLERARTNGKAVLKPTRQRRTPAFKRQVVASAPSATQKFVIEYQTQMVLRAADIRDALRQASARGAVNILAATRE